MVPLSPFPRLKDAWAIGYIKGGVNTELVASKGADQSQPPTNGWRREHFGQDVEYMSCTTPVTSPSCCLTVSLSGSAKEAQGNYEGKYKSIGLASSGRPVTIMNDD